MMKMIKLIATDMDGTLLNLFHTTDLYVLETINKINESDINLCFATARHMHKHMLKRLGLMSKHFFAIGMNGAIIKDDRGNILRMSPIDKDTLSALIDNLPIKDFMFFDENNSYTTLSRNEFKGAMFKSIRRLVNTFSDYGLNLDNIVFSVTKEELMKKNILDLTSFCLSKKKVRKIKQFLKGKKVTETSSGFIGIDIIDKNVNKGEAVKWLMNYLDLSEEEVAVFGDSTNDMEMIDSFYYSYAPNNADKVIKHLANFGCDSNFNYGPCMVMREIVENKGEIIND